MGSAGANSSEQGGSFLISLDYCSPGFSGTFLLFPVTAAFCQEWGLWAEERPSWRGRKSAAKAGVRAVPCRGWGPSCRLALPGPPLPSVCRAVLFHGALYNR